MTTILPPSDSTPAPAKRNMFKEAAFDGIFGATAKLGVPIVLSVGLSIFLVLRVDSALAAVAKTTIENQQLMKSAGTTMASFAGDNLTNQRVLRNLALQTCLNVAKTEMQNDACLRAAEK